MEALVGLLIGLAILIVIIYWILLPFLLLNKMTTMRDRMDKANNRMVEISALIKKNTAKQDKHLSDLNEWVDSFGNAAETYMNEMLKTKEISP